MFRYNHHYMAWMTGAASEMQHVFPEEGDEETYGQPLDAMGRRSKWMAVPKPGATPTPTPSSQMFSEGNGGESRKSYHGSALAVLLLRYQDAVELHTKLTLMAGF